MGIKRFAAWRWEMFAVTVGLGRQGDAVRLAVGRFGSAQSLGSSEDGGAATFFDGDTQGTFWADACRLLSVLRPLRDLASWVRGFPCHTADAQAGRVVKGSRAPELWSRLQKTEQELQSMIMVILADTYSAGHPVEVAQLAP